MKWVVVNKLLLAVSYYFTDKLHNLTTLTLVGQSLLPISSLFWLLIQVCFVSVRPSLFATVCSLYDAVGSFWVDVIGIWSHVFLAVIVRFTLPAPHAEMHQHSSDEEHLKTGREQLISLKSGMLSPVCWLPLSSSFFSLLDTWTWTWFPSECCYPLFFF